VSRVTPVQTAMRNCTRDEGRPFEVGNQVLISSHRKLLSSKAEIESRELWHRLRREFRCSLYSPLPADERRGVRTARLSWGERNDDTKTHFTSDGASPDHPNRDSRIGSGCRTHHFPRPRPYIVGRNRSHNSFHLPHRCTGHTTAQRAPHRHLAIKRRRGRIPRRLSA
jgi:hypothetical protein